MTPVTDDIVAIRNGRFFPTRNYDLVYSYQGTAQEGRVRLITPSFRQVSTPWLVPLNLGVEPGSDPSVADYRSNPLTLRGLEEVEAEATNTDAVAAADYVVVEGWQLSYEPMPAGDIWTMRGTGTTTVTADNWTTVAITWQDMLPVGRYVVVGGHFVSTTGIAWRIIFEDQTARPGGLCVDSSTEMTHPMFRWGGLGVWGHFDSNRMPLIQAFCDAADTAQTIYLDFVRIG
jgi:hypothetical protein